MGWPMAQRIRLFHLEVPFQDVRQLRERLVNVLGRDRLAPMGDAGLAELPEHPGQIEPVRKRPLLVQALDKILQGSGTGRFVEPSLVNIADHQFQHVPGQGAAPIFGSSFAMRIALLIRSQSDCLSGHELFQTSDQPVHLALKIRPGPDRGGVAIGQLLQAIRQIGLARHRGPADQQGHHGNAASQGGFDLDAHIILRVIQPPRVFPRPVR